MKTKVFNSITPLAVVFVLFLTSCKKYPDGPAISLRSRAERVSNAWKVESVTLNGNDITSSFTSINYTENYDKDGNYSYSSSIGNGSGKWAFENNDEQIKRSGVSGQSSISMTILRLKENSFWYEFKDGSDNFHFHLIPK